MWKADQRPLSSSRLIRDKPTWVEPLGLSPKHITGRTVLFCIAAFITVWFVYFHHHPVSCKWWEIFGQSRYPPFLESELVLCISWIELQKTWVGTRFHPNKLKTRVWFWQLELNIVLHIVIMHSQITSERLQHPNIMHLGRICKGVLFFSDHPPKIFLYWPPPIQAYKHTSIEYRNRNLTFQSLEL